MGFLLRIYTDLILFNAVYIKSVEVRAYMANATDFFNAYRNRNAQNVQWQAFLLDLKYPEGVPSTPKGKEKQVFQVGQVVETTATATLKSGIRFTIQSVMEDNGFYRYLGGGVWHCTQDLKAV